MTEKLEALRAQAAEELAQLHTVQELEALRVKLLGKKGALTDC